MYKKVNKKKSKKVIDESKLDNLKETKDKSSNSKDKSKVRANDDDLNSIQFASGNSLVEVTNGVIYYFVEIEFEKCDEKGQKSELILMLQVPISFTTQELLQFTGPVCQTVEQIRIIRDSKPNNQYMALIKFKNQQSADEFFTNFNGVRFNSIEPEVCKLVYVERIELSNDDNKTNNDLINKTELSMVGIMNGEQSTCTFCLENMNEELKDKDNQDNLNSEQNDAILTVLCGHSFHSNCLMKWPGKVFIVYFYSVDLKLIYVSF